MAAVVAKYTHEWELVEEWLKEPYPTSKEEFHRINTTRWLSNEQGDIVLQVGLRKVEKPIHNCFVKVLWMGIVNGFGPMADVWEDGCRKGHGTKMIQKLNDLVCKHTAGGLYIQDCLSDSANNWAKKMSNQFKGIWIWNDEEHGLYSCDYSCGCVEIRIGCGRKVRIGDLVAEKDDYLSNDSNTIYCITKINNNSGEITATNQGLLYTFNDPQQLVSMQQPPSRLKRKEPPNNNNEGDTKKAKANTVEQVVENDNNPRKLEEWQSNFKNKFYCEEFHLADVVCFLNEAKEAGYSIDLSDKVDIENERIIFHYVLRMATYGGEDTFNGEYGITTAEIKNDVEDLKTFFNYGKGLWKRYWDCENNEWNSPLSLIESCTNIRRNCAIDMLPFLKENGHEIDKNERVTLSKEVRDAWDKLNGENPV